MAAAQCVRCRALPPREYSGDLSLGRRLQPVEAACRGARQRERARLDDRPSAGGVRGRRHGGCRSDRRACPSRPPRPAGRGRGRRALPRPRRRRRSSACASARGAARAPEDVHARGAVRDGTGAGRARRPELRAGGAALLGAGGRVATAAWASRVLPLPLYPDQLARLRSDKPVASVEAARELGFAPRALRDGLGQLADESR